MPPAFQVKDFLTLPELGKTENFRKTGIRKVSVPIQLHTKFCCRQDTLKEILSFYNVAAHAITDSNSYTKIIGISGEGGIGKSRLVLEFLKKISSPNSPIRINYSDKNNIVFNNKFEKLKDYFDSTIKSLNKKNIPAIFILEDFHWYEAEEKRKIEKLLFTFSGELPIPFRLSVIFLISYRENQTSAGFKKYDSFEEISLSPFSEEESGTFIRNLFLPGKRKLIKNSLLKIINLSAGIPFYLEEFSKSVIQSKNLEIIPGSVENLLSFKISFLREDVKKVFEIISVWDGSIDLQILKNICDKLRMYLPSHSVLQSSGIIKIEIKHGKTSYSFTHDIYKNFIQNNIESFSRTVIHKTIASLMEKEIIQSEHLLYKLFYHYKSAEEKEKAYQYLETYVKKVIEHREYESALQRVDELIKYYSTDGYKQLEIRMLKIKCLRMLVRTSDMNIELNEIKNKLSKYRNEEIHLNYLWLLAEFDLLSNNFTGAFRIISKGLKLAKLQKNFYMEAEFQFLLTRNLNTTGKVSECLIAAEHLIKLGNSINEKKFYYWGNYLMAACFLSIHNDEGANSIIDHCLEKLKSDSLIFFYNLFSKAKARYYFQLGKYEKFITQSKEQYTIDISANDIHHSIICLLNISDCLILSKNFTEAEEILNKVVKFASKNNSILFLKRCFEGLLNLKIGTDEYAEANLIGFRLFKLYDKNDYKNLSALYSNMIIVSYSLGNFKESYKNYVKALYYSKKIKSLSDEIISNYNIGYVYYLQGDIILAKKYILRAYKLTKLKIDVNFNFEINFSLAEIYMITNNITKSFKILIEISAYFENSDNAQLCRFFRIFYELLLNYNNIGKYKKFLTSESLQNFISDISIDYLTKIKILYFAIFLGEKCNANLPVLISNQAKIFVNKIKTKNKTILFYLNKIQYPI